MTEKWRSEPDDSPRRDLFDLRCIAEVVSRFDIVAIEEAREDLSALRLVLEALGDSWGLIATDVTRGRAGNNERLVFVFDTRRLRPSGLAGELVVALEEETTLTSSDLERQFARTPYAVSFTTGREELTLVVLHILWGKNEDERVPELREIATWLADWPRREETWSKNLIALGDFNVEQGAALRRSHGDGLDDADRVGVRPADDLRFARKATLLRPDRLVRGERQPLGPFARLPQRRKLRLRPAPSRRASQRPSSRGRSPTITRSGSSSRCGRQFRDS